jgi:dienelactone hydrolase
MNNRVPFELMRYTDHGTALEAFITRPNKPNRPLVILCHAWRGKDPFICEKAELMARWGYVGFALDVYGAGVLGKSKEENAALKKPFLQDRAMLRRRLLKGFEVATALPEVDASRVGVVGFGFGGLCALDLARSGVPLKGAVSVYSHFDAPQLPKHPMHGKILILHGAQDPVVPLEDLRMFEREMTETRVDWEARLYGSAMHAFATPGVNDPAAGLLYNADAADRVESAIRKFLEEIFGVRH